MLSIIGFVGDEENDAHDTFCLRITHLHLYNSKTDFKSQNSCSDLRASAFAFLEEEGAPLLPIYTLFRGFRKVCSYMI